jgi:hypothetical protein
VTVFLADISSYEHGLSIADLRDCAGILAKCSEGVYYGDADYDGWRRQTAALGKIFVAYDFVRADETADAQAAWIAAHIADKTLPLMLDVETEGASKPTFPQVLALINACVARGLRPKLVYLPRWYWQQIGSPDMSALNTLGIGLISSAYPSLTIAAAGQVYAADGGDSGTGWQSYGGVTPLLWQFSDRILDAGQSLDMNAYRGTAAQLAAFLGGTPTTAGDDVTPQDIQAIAAAVYAYGREDINLSTGVMHNVPLGNLAHGAWVSVNDPNGPVLSRLAALEAQVKALAAAPPIDVKALAAAEAPALAAVLAPLLQAGATADEVAVAVLRHLSTATANG